MLQSADPALILASTSPTRAALMRAAGLRFETASPGVDEESIKEAARSEGSDPADCAMLLAQLKASRISARAPQALVVAADQILVCDGEWYDKPPDRAAAARALRALSGRTHMLVTAVLCVAGSVRQWQHLATPRLTMRRLSDTAIEAYLAAEGEAVMGSVGAYRVEGLGLRLFQAIEGDHPAILGLPMLPLLAYLRQRSLLAD